MARGSEAYPAIIFVVDSENAVRSKPGFGVTEGNRGPIFPSLDATANTLCSVDDVVQPRLQFSNGTFQIGNVVRQSKLNRQQGSLGRGRPVGPNEHRSR